MFVVDICFVLASEARDRRAEHYTVRATLDGYDERVHDDRLGEAAAQWLYEHPDEVAEACPRVRRGNDGLGDQSPAADLVVRAVSVIEDEDSALEDEDGIFDASSIEADPMSAQRRGL